MGVPIGATLGTVGLFAPDARTMLRETLHAFGMVALVTAVTALLGLLWGVICFHGPNPSIPNDWYVPEHLQNRNAYLRAGSMHDASYVGGGSGTMAAAVWLARRVTRARR